MGNHPAAAADPIGRGGIGEIHKLRKKNGLKELRRSQKQRFTSAVGSVPRIRFLCPTKLVMMELTK
jgi:hypothetical protein